MIGIKKEDLEVLALIPARGGSKGIPRKNVQLIADKPLLAYSIQQAVQTPAISRVVVSTDDTEIAGVAEECGAEVIWRPPEISGETAASESALLHALDYLSDTEVYEPDLVVFLQATSPIRQPDDIQNAIKKLHSTQADSLFSACAIEGGVWQIEGDHLSSVTYDYRHRIRRQDSSQDLLENGAIYLYKPWILRKFNNRLG